MHRSSRQRTKTRDWRGLTRLETLYLEQAKLLEGLLGAWRRVIDERGVENEHKYQGCSPNNVVWRCGRFASLPEPQSAFVAHLIDLYHHCRPHLERASKAM